MNPLKKILSFLRTNKGVNLTPSVSHLDAAYGHFVTKEKSLPILSDTIVPWFTYPAIEFLIQLDISEKDVFEWGSGNSSIFFANQAKTVVSIEHDYEWFQKSLTRKLPNQVIHFADLDSYHNTISHFEKKFDIVLIDGQSRLKCSQACVNHVKEDGVIILDNSDWFYKSAEFLRNNTDFIQLDFSGFGPINDYTWTTSFFISPRVRLKYCSSKIPISPLGSIFHDEELM